MDAFSGSSAPDSICFDPPGLARKEGRSCRPIVAYEAHQFSIDGGMPSALCTMRISTGPVRSLPSEA
jgi:hypothetical protein